VTLSIKEMQKLSLKVLLRFLSSYSHWNLVRRDDCYHLYFVTKDSSTGSIATFSQSTKRTPNKRKCHSKGRKRLSWKRNHKSVVQQAKEVNYSIPGDTSKQSKDVFLFSPIFETPEQAVSVGLDDVQQTLGHDPSKRSSLNSLLWDDFDPPYIEDRNGGDSDSFSTIETDTDFDSKESTPFFIGDREPVLDRDLYYENSVRVQSDRLLRDMLQLRKDIEQEFRDSTEQDKIQGDKWNGEDNSMVKDQTENVLRERLEQMTQQVKQEMNEELARKESQIKSLDKPGNNKDSNSMKSYFNKMLEKKENNNEDTDKVCKLNGESTENNLIQKSERESIENKDDNNDLKSEPNSSQSGGKFCVNGDDKSDLDLPITSNSHKDSTKKEKVVKEVKSQGIEPTKEVKEVKGELSEQMSKQKIESQKDAKGDNTDKSSAVSTVNNKTNKKLKKQESAKNNKKKINKSKEKDNKAVEVPFCSHNQHSTGQDLTGFTSTTPPDKKRGTIAKNYPVLSRDDRLAAEEILMELLEIRDGKKKAEKDPVLDTMISVIQLSSTNLSLPAQSSSINGIQFKELFDFEVNFSESREAFNKLAMGTGGKHSAQDLFPYSRGDKSEFRKLRDNLV